MLTKIVTQQNGARRFYNYIHIFLKIINQSAEMLKNFL